MGERTANWYFDFISPFAWLQWPRVRQLAAQRAVEFRPILFASLLQRLDHKGPAEIPGKREFTYRHVQWRAERLGLPLRFPPSHPFNPLAALRLCIPAGSSEHAIATIFNCISADGHAGDTAAALEDPAARLRTDDVAAAISQLAVKQALAANFDTAVTDRVFGVPSLVHASEVSWGEDATGMFEAFLADPAMFQNAEARRLAELPGSAAVREARRSESRAAPHIQSFARSASVCVARRKGPYTSTGGLE